MSEKFFHQPSVMTNSSALSHVPSAEIQRSTFNRGAGHKTTIDGGRLVPLFVDEVLPGDTFNMSETIFARLSTPLRPVMDNMYLETFWFFVPNRLLWDNWQRFCGERTFPGDDATTLSIPQILFDPAEIDHNALPHYMGVPLLPTGAGTGQISVNALPFRAYGMIWNEYFRDQNIMNPSLFNTGDGPDDGTGWVECIPRSKRHDYFTSCLPWPQKGAAVNIPLDGVSIQGKPGVYPLWGRGANPATSGPLETIASGARTVELVDGGGISKDKVNWVDPALELVIGNSGTTINDLRAAFQIQRLLERDARGGTRYIELILSHFGVRSDDARLQRPEYLGGSSQRLNIEPIASTFANAEIAQGDLGGVGVAVGRGRWSKSFTEHGYILGLVNVRADLNYQNNLDKLWTRKTRWDFYWPALANIGEQAVLNKELYFLNDPTTDDQVFGYQERYGEYRYKNSRVSGRMSSVDATSIDVWHLAQDFGATRPVLNTAFIMENPPFDRIVAVPTEPHFLIDAFFDLKCSRPMPIYAVPGFVDHF